MRWSLLGCVAVMGLVALLVSGLPRISLADSKMDEAQQQEPKQEKSGPEEVQPEEAKEEPKTESQQESGVPAKPAAVEKKLSREERMLKDHPHGKQIGEMLRLHNEARARYNLRPFRMNPRLNQAAQRFAQYMGRTRSFGHYADGRSPGDRMRAEGYPLTSWAENISWTGSQPRAAMGTWMNSGGHRANILSGHDEVGFGLHGEIWVAVFGNAAYDEQEAE